MMLGKRTVNPNLVFAVFLVFMLSLLFPGFSGGFLAAETSHTQPIGELDVGDRVVDLTWKWQFRTGNNYSGGGETKPIVWRVAAKNHYSGIGSHVTLVSEELIAKYAFNSGRHNHWGNSYIRTWLKNSFYNAISANFKNNILTTTLPNRVSGTGVSYTTSDKIFLPSQTELAGGNYLSYEIGSSWELFSDDRSRGAAIGGRATKYWTRSPVASGNSLRNVGHGGNFVIRHSDVTESGVRPALNLSSDILVSVTPNKDGIHEFLYFGPGQSASQYPEDDGYVKSPAAGSQMFPFMLTGVILIFIGLILTLPVRKLQKV